MLARDDYRGRDNEILGEDGGGGSRDIAGKYGEIECAGFF
jgi:hypothetical protein